MKLRGWLALIAVSAIGFVATFWLFPKVMPAARWSHAIDHDTAIAIAKKTALELGATEINLQTNSSLSLNDDVNIDFPPFIVGQYEVPR